MGGTNIRINFYHITVNVYYSEHGGNESSFNLIWKQKSYQTF